MNKSRSRLMAGLAALTLAGFAATSYGQNTNTPATTGGGVSAPAADQSAPAAQAPATTNGSANTQAAPVTGTDATIGTSSRTTTTATDVTTTQPATTTFWLSGWGLAALAVVAILVLWAIFGRRNRTVVSDTYSTSSTTRNYGTAPTTDRMISPQAASGTEKTTRVTETDTRL
jgi:hypothetical protein